jgi:hypothetical protein
MKLGTSGQDISVGPIKVLINANESYSTVINDYNLDLMKLSSMAAYGFSRDKKNNGRYLVVLFYFLHGNEYIMFLNDLDFFLFVLCNDTYRFHVQMFLNFRTSYLISEERLW